jgi:3-dehydroquinate dehydratase II
MRDRRARVKDPLERRRRRAIAGNRVNPIVVVLNGPNLNLLGKREPEIYGRETLADVEADCCRIGGELGLSIEFHQSNREYEIIDWIHSARERAAGIVINPAAFTHTSVAILDALNTFEGPIIEVHISNVHKREPFRHHSYVSGVASGVIVGCGTQGYAFALQRIAKVIAERKGQQVVHHEKRTRKAIRRSDV